MEPWRDELYHFYASKYYDPVKAHEYYLRTRKLKGRKKKGSIPRKQKTKQAQKWESRIPNYHRALDELHLLKRRIAATKDEAKDIHMKKAPKGNKRRRDEYQDLSRRGRLRRKMLGDAYATVDSMIKGESRYLTKQELDKLDQYWRASRNIEKVRKKNQTKRERN